MAPRIPPLASSARSRRRRLATVAATAALLVGSACGGDDTATPGEDAPPTTSGTTPLPTSPSTPSTPLTGPAPTTTLDPSPLRCTVTVSGDVVDDYVGTDRWVTREPGPEDSTAFLSVGCGTIVAPDLRLRFEIMSETAGGFAPGPQEFPVVGRPEDELEPGIARAGIGIAGDAFTPTGGHIAFERLEDTGYRGSFEVDAEQLPSPGVAAPKRITLTGTFDFPCADAAAPMCI
jgi:hypothetical protein